MPENGNNEGSFMAFGNLKTSREGSILSILNERKIQRGVPVTEGTAPAPAAAPVVPAAPAPAAANEALPKRKTAAELKKVRKMAKKREMKTTDKSRSTSMKRVWASKRKAMLVGWKNRKKLYGPSGRKAAESLSSILSTLDSYREAGTVLAGEDYEELKNLVSGYMTAVMADEEITPDQIYEAILFNVAPLMAIVESVAERDDSAFEARDIENLDKYVEFIESEELNDEPVVEGTDDGTDNQ